MAMQSAFCSKRSSLELGSRRMKEGGGGWMPLSSRLTCAIKTDLQTRLFARTRRTESLFKKKNSSLPITVKQHTPAHSAEQNIYRGGCALASQFGLICPTWPVGSCQTAPPHGEKDVYLWVLFIAAFLSCVLSLFPPCPISIL